MPLHLSIQPSFRLTLFLMALHLGVFFSVFLSAAPTGLKIIAASICLYSAWYTIRKYALLTSARSIIYCAAPENNLWSLTDRQGRAYTARLLGDTWRSRYLLILHFEKKQSCESSLKAKCNFWQQRRTVVILMPDMLDAMLFRQLQVHLTIQKQDD